MRNIDNDYIVLMDLDFSWKNEEIEKVIELWNKGYGIDKIKEKLNRNDGDEVFLLLLDLARKNKNAKRLNDIWGVA